MKREAVEALSKPLVFGEIKAEILGDRMHYEVIKKWMQQNPESANRVIDSYDRETVLELIEELYGILALASR